MLAYAASPAGNDDPDAQPLNPSASDTNADVPKRRTPAAIKYGIFPCSSQRDEIDGFSRDTNFTPPNRYTGYSIPSCCAAAILHDEDRY
jgi:hypothetical protein